MSLKVRFRETLIQLYGSAGLKNHSTNSTVQPDSSALFLSLRMRCGKPLDVYWLLTFPVTENSVLVWKRDFTRNTVSVMAAAVVESACCRRVENNPNP